MNIASEKIKVFPAVGRSTTYKDSYLTTEDNLTKRIIALYGKNNSSFVLNDTAAFPLKFVIHGYYFEVLENSSIDLSNSLYARIYISKDPENAKYQKLINDGSESSAENLDYGGNFLGIYFQTTPFSADENIDRDTFDLQILDNGSIPAKSKIYWKSSEIYNGDSSDGINTKFTSQDIHASSSLTVQTPNVFKVDAEGTINMSGVVTIGSASESNHELTVYDTLKLNNRNSGFAIQGGKSTTKTLDIAENASFNATTNVNSPLVVGASGTGQVNIKSAASGDTTIIGPNSGTAQFDSGWYKTKYLKAVFTGSKQTGTFTGTSTNQLVTNVTSNAVTNVALNDLASSDSGSISYVKSVSYTAPKATSKYLGTSKSSSAIVTSSYSNGVLSIQAGEVLTGINNTGSSGIQFVEAISPSNNDLSVTTKHLKLTSASATTTVTKDTYTPAGTITLNNPAGTIAVSTQDTSETGTTNVVITSAVS